MIRATAAIPAFLLAGAVGLAACQRDAGDTDAAADPPASDVQHPPVPDMAAPSPAEAGRRPALTVSEGEPVHLVDAAGQALYMLEGNEDGSRCDAECEDAWPPVLAEDAEPDAGPGSHPTRLGTMRRPDGGFHVTYHGQPLYRYAADSGAGATAGHAVEDQWGTWSLVSPEGPPVPHD